VRVEVLAQNLGVTKGGFYRRFRDRRDLLEAVLAAWSAGRIAAIEHQTRLDGATARERLRALIKLYAGRLNTEAMAVELAIRQWARTDPAAATAAATVDTARLKNVTRLYGALGLAADDARAQAFLFYSFVFGQSLIFLQQSGPRRDRLLATCAARLTEVERADATPAV
jgi:AcrR family transcriptional regulator